jgi:hypothetical protein
MLNMKKIYAYLMLCLPMLGFAQKDVTFIVDMRDTTLSYSGVYVNGDFNSWCGTCNPLSDPEGDSVWTVTLPLTSDSIEYKFTLDGWTQQEEYAPGTPGTKTTGIYTNRFAVLNGDTILSGKEYNSAYAVPGQVYITIQVNMSYTAVDTTGVWLAGGTGFATPGVNQMYPIGDSVYSKTLARDTGFYSMFTFLSSNDPGWGSKENIVGKPCAAGQWSDRDMVGYSATMGLMSDFHYRTCFGECTTDGTCPVPATPENYTFQVDLSGIAGTFTQPYLTGSMDQWSGNTHAMSDADGDSIWDVTIALLPGVYEYKFTYDSWAGQEMFNPSTSDSLCTITTGQFTNRIVTVSAGSDSTLDANCWEVCGECGFDMAIAEEGNTFSIKPNPASDLLIIENTTGTRSTVVMYNITGAKVLEQSFDAEARLDVAAMPRGMYIVRVQNGSTESVVRVALK